MRIACNLPRNKFFTSATRNFVDSRRRCLPPCRSIEGRSLHRSSVHSWGSCVTPIVAFLASVAPMNMHCTAARNLQPHWRNDGARDKEAIWLSSMEMSLSVWMDRCEVPECRKNQMMLQNDTFMLQTSDQGVSIYESFILQNTK